MYACQPWKEGKAETLWPNGVLGRTPRELEEEYAKNKINKTAEHFSAVKRGTRQARLITIIFMFLPMCLKKSMRWISQELIISRSSRICMSRCVTCIGHKPSETRWEFAWERREEVDPVLSGNVLPFTTLLLIARHVHHSAFFPPLQPPDSPIMCA